MLKKKIHTLPAAFMIAALASCGGGGGDGAPVVAAVPPVTGTAPPITPPVTPPTVPTVPPLPAAIVPILSPIPTTLELHANIGVVAWPDGPTATGGRGATTDGVNCVSSEIYHIHAHIAIIKDGQVLAIPESIGLQGCTYEMHTHDRSGVAHIETTTQKPFVLRQFFSLWGQPLSRTNIAGLTGLPVTVYINDAAGLIEYKGELGDIELTQHREITILVGTIPTEIPSYKWVNL